MSEKENLPYDFNKEHPDERFPINMVDLVRTRLFYLLFEIAKDYEILHPLNIEQNPFVFPSSSDERLEYHPNTDESGKQLPTIIFRSSRNGEITTTSIIFCDLYNPDENIIFHENVVTDSTDRSRGEFFTTYKIIGSNIALISDNLIYPKIFSEENLMSDHIFDRFKKISIFWNNLITSDLKELISTTKESNPHKFNPAAHRSIQRLSAKNPRNN